MGVLTTIKGCFNTCYSICCCGMCQDTRSLEEKLEDDKLFNFYWDIVPEADGLIRVKSLTLNGMIEMDGEFTNAQMALRKDLINRKVEWTGDWLMDYKYYLWFNHPILAIWKASHADSFDRGERMSVLIMQCGINSVLSYVIVTLQHECSTGNEQACNAHMPVNFVFGLFLAMIVKLLRMFAECGCVQGCNSCIRRCCEALGKCAMMVFLLKSLLAFTITIILALYYTGNLGTYFQAFVISICMSWFLTFGTAFVFFLYARRCERKMSKSDKDHPIFKLTLEKCKEAIRFQFADRDWRFWAKVISLVWFFMDDEDDWSWTNTRNDSAIVPIKAEQVEIQIDEDSCMSPIVLKKIEDNSIKTNNDDEVEIDVEQGENSELTTEKYQKL